MIFKSNRRLPCTAKSYTTKILRFSPFSCESLLHTFSRGQNKMFEDKPKTNARGQNYFLEASLASRT